MKLEVAPLFFLLLIVLVFVCSVLDHAAVVTKPLVVAVVGSGTTGVLQSPTNQKLTATVVAREKTSIELEAKPAVDTLRPSVNLFSFCFQPR